MQKRFVGKTAVITGGASGIGLAIARRFVQEGGNSTAIDRFGAVDASFHVAGANKHAYIARMAEADWDFTINLCLKGVMFAMKHAAQAMLK